MGAMAARGRSRATALRTERGWPQKSDEVDATHRLFPSCAQVGGIRAAHLWARRLQAAHAQGAQVEEQGEATRPVAQLRSTWWQHAKRSGSSAPWAVNNVRTAPRSGHSVCIGLPAFQACVRARRHDESCTNRAVRERGGTRERQYEMEGSLCESIGPSVSAICESRTITKIACVFERRAFVEVDQRTRNRLGDINKVPPTLLCDIHGRDVSTVA